VRAASEYPALTVTNTEQSRWANGLRKREDGGEIGGSRKASIMLGFDSRDYSKGVPKRFTTLTDPELIRKNRVVLNSAKFRPGGRERCSEERYITPPHSCTRTPEGTR